jgi:hypothetical protein
MRAFAKQNSLCRRYTLSNGGEVLLCTAAGIVAFAKIFSTRKSRSLAPIKEGFRAKRFWSAGRPRHRFSPRAWFDPKRHGDVSHSESFAK